MACLVLLTESYPYGGVGEPGFIEPEIEFLAKEFERVIIAPVLDFGERTPLPANVSVSNLMLHRPGVVAKFRSLFSRLTLQSLYNNRRRIKNARNLRSDLAFSAYTLYYKRRLETLIMEFSLSLDDTLFYTFWFDYMTSALTLIPGAKFVTRTHGQDTFESGTHYISRYWRQKTFANLEICFPVSDYASSYLQSLYPTYAHKIKRSYLGTPSPSGIISEDKSTSEKKSIYSCGRIVPDKRVLFQFDVISQYAHSHPDTAINWLHIGNGPQMPELREKIKSAPKNLSVELTGDISNREVHEILSTHYFDLMLHLSRSEGLGLAICEAMSYAIPALVTDAEAMPEAIGATGFLISTDASADEVADILANVLEQAPAMRQAARKEWENRFNASLIRPEFASYLRSLLKPTSCKSAIPESPSLT